MAENEVRIVIVENDYMEAYAPFPKNPKELDDKVKKGMLKSIGMKDEEIEGVIDSLEIEYVAGADGMFDDGPMTPIRLVKVIRREPPIPPPPPIPPTPPEEDEHEKEDDPEHEDDPIRKPQKGNVKNNPRQTMLQQYYGDRDAESRRVKTFDRFKSHVIQKSIDICDENGTKRRVKVYTVEDYEGKEKDSDELLLEGYQTRLERLSRAHQGDFTPYKREYERLIKSAIKEIIEKYEEMHRVNPEDAEKFKEEAMQEMSLYVDPDFEHQAIQALIDKDTEFIETNNYTYNSRQNTAENLKTLGKFGEKSVKAQVSDEQPLVQRLGLHTMNALIAIRNHTKVPVNKAIGTYVASPIFRALLGVTQSKSKEPVEVDGFYITPMEDMLATSQKHSRGTFKNKPSHRYHARKDYFLAQEMESDNQGNDDVDKNGEKKVKRTTLGKLIKLAIVPRFKAVFNYREGNTAILNAGLYDIERATEERKQQMEQKALRVDYATRTLECCEQELAQLHALENIVKDPVEKEKLQKTIEQREHQRSLLKIKLDEVVREEIDSVSTDAVSMSQHDKANKATVTHVIHGVRTTARVTAGILISKYLYREVEHTIKDPDTLKYEPGKEIEITEKVKEIVPGMDKEDVTGITLDEIYAKGSGKLSYYAFNGGRKIEDKTSYFRGLAFEYKGQVISGSDGKGFDPTDLTDVKIDQALDGNTSMVSVVKEILEDKTGQTFTEEQISEMIINGQISKIDVWRSTSKSGIPTGWINSTEIIPEIINSGSHEIIREIKKKIRLPGKWVRIPGEEHTITTTELNPVVVAAEVALGAMEASDWNDLMRFTRSQESIHMRQPRILQKMRMENERIRAEKAKQNGKEPPKSKEEPTKVEKRRGIKSFQRSNKSKSRRYTFISAIMKRESERAVKEGKAKTVWEGFTGSRRKDFASGYDENLIGTNDKEIHEDDGRL